jgi:hypothetical protein
MNRCRESDGGTMFSHADRFPLRPVTTTSRPVARPWGLSRMMPFGALVEIDVVPVGLDPSTQTTRYQGADGNAPTSDQDHSQDSDND